MSESQIHLRLGTRGSLLARAQSEQIAEALRDSEPNVEVELVEIKTTGDRITDKPLHEFGGKGLFTKELEQALLDKTIDFAVHSLKDVPVTMPLVDQSNLIVAAIPQREDARDVLVSVLSKSLGGFASGARIGTSSLRRKCQLLAKRPDLNIQMIRGNIDTRIRKLKSGEFDAIILAMAGVKRAKLFDPAIMHPIDPDQILPAPGQGALALQCRRDDRRTIDILVMLNDPITELCTRLERDLVRELNGDCHSPIAAYAVVATHLTFRAAVGARDGGLPVVRTKSIFSLAEADFTVLSVLKELRGQGVKELLNSGSM